ncbi:hypothetical protein FGB62_3g127 [Gracilaria domingensis]|nr:hypothetical protein FGB62_3g127 [Gracilaria domingensis]
MQSRMYSRVKIEAGSEACHRKRLDRINTMSNDNDFIPYLCYNHNNKYMTVIGMHLNPFNLSKLAFFLNGHQLEHMRLSGGKKAFALNVPIKPEQLVKNREQILSFSLSGCSYHMKCPSYFEKRRDELNLCVYTMRNKSVLEPFLNHYGSFVDRMFIYSTHPKSYSTLRPLNRRHQGKFRVVPWYLRSLRDPNIFETVYQELIQHNYRNYPRDMQKVQTNDCLYRNRNTNMVLMVDDDEYLNYLNRDFYRSLYEELKDKKDDVIFNRNFCNATVEVNTQLSFVLNKTTTKCPEGRKKRLEKAFVLPKNCPVYEIHRCVTYNSFSLSHLNIYATHRPYSLNRRQIFD